MKLYLLCSLFLKTGILIHFYLYTSIPIMSYWETKWRNFIALQGYLNCKKWLIKNGKKQTKL